MRQAIETQYHGPTNHRGARIIAKAQAGRMTVPWDYAKDIDENHANAAKAFAAKMGWAGIYYGGGLANGRGYVFVSTYGSNHAGAAFRVGEGFDPMHGYEVKQ